MKCRSVNLETSNPAESLAFSSKFRINLFQHHCGSNLEKITRRSESMMQRQYHYLKENISKH